MKSSSNKSKHGIDFLMAQKLWEDAAHLEIPAVSVDEPRFQVLGLIDTRVWSAFITYRDETVRIISVRRARTNEEQIYYDR